MNPNYLQGTALFVSLSLWLTLIGCATGPRTTSKEFFQLSQDSAANKAMQTRRVEAGDDEELLSASAAALQDLGFQVTEVDTGLGFLRAAKERSARETGQEWSQGTIAFLTTLATITAAAAGSTSSMIVIPPVDLHQQINASLVARPLADKEGESRFQVRIMFYRLIWKGEGQSGNVYIPPGEQVMEMIRDPEIYQRFFARLNKSVFLEAERI